MSFLETPRAPVSEGRLLQPGGNTSFRPSCRAGINPQFATGFRCFQWNRKDLAQRREGTKKTEGPQSAAHTKSTKGHKEACKWGNIAGQATLLVMGAATPCAPRPSPSPETRALQRVLYVLRALSVNLPVFSLCLGAFVRGPSPPKTTRNLRFSEAKVRAPREL